MKLAVNNILLTMCTVIFAMLVILHFKLIAVFSICTNLVNHGTLFNYTISFGIFCWLHCHFGTLRTINHCEPGSLSSGKCFDCQATTTSLHNSKNMLCSILLAIILCAPIRKASRGGMLATQGHIVVKVQSIVFTSVATHSTFTRRCNSCLCSVIHDISMTQALRNVVIDQQCD